MKSKRAGRPRLVVVTPVLNEAENIAAYVDRVTAILLSDPGLDAHVLFVDDGSADASWAAIETVCAADPRFRGVRLSRNFGAHVALAAGFDHVDRQADIVATLACDLQDPPETVLAFVAAWRAGADIVWGERQSRRDSGWRKIASGMLERMLRRYAMPRGSKFRTGSFLLMDRRVLECFLQYRENSRVTFALVAWTGFDQAVVGYERRPRLKGRSGWSFWRMASTAYDVFIGFSAMPAKALTFVGTSVFVLSLGVLTYLVVYWFLADVQPGWTGIMATMTFFFGLLFMMLGIIVEYLFRIFIETKARPLYFIAEEAGAPRPERAAP
ncbi:MAG: glycosyltransferase family 2 protein [Hyphomicrobiaceae bacterium]|nr:glycosyltransferase family 2 protein [Hyphomicrobiaceae bacterium]